MVGICVFRIVYAECLAPPLICILPYSCDGDLAVYIKALESRLARIPPNSLSKVSTIYKPWILNIGK